MDYLYLHGFASGPQSHKGQVLKHRFAALGLSLTLLDLNQGDFTHLTLSRQIQQGVDWLEERSAVTVIGSSFGGLTAAWLAQQPQVQGKIQRLVLLAPAFGFLAHWLPRLGAETLAQWRDSGFLTVYHYGDRCQYPLAYGFVTDLQQYPDRALTAPVPTLIIHGTADEVIPVAASVAYCRDRPWVRLLTPASDHSLTDQAELIWQAMVDFLALSSLA